MLKFTKFYSKRQIEEKRKGRGRGGKDLTYFPLANLIVWLGITIPKQQSVNDWSPSLFPFIHPPVLALEAGVCKRYLQASLQKSWTAYPSRSTQQKFLKKAVSSNPDVISEKKKETKLLWLLFTSDRRTINQELASVTATEAIKWTYSDRKFPGFSLGVHLHTECTDCSLFLF